MKIVIDCRFYSVQAGIGRYIRNLIYNLQKIDSENEYYLLFLKEDYDSFKERNNFKKVLANFRWYTFSEQIKLPQIINKINPNLLHFPHFNIPIIYKGKFVVTIHDLTHQYFSMKRVTTHDPIIYFIKQKGYKVVFRKAIQDSTKIITPSNYVKNLITKEYNILEEKIKVTYEAVEDSIISFQKKMTKDEYIKILNSFSVRQPYIFYVGNAHPHKNVEGLIKAFLNLKKRYPKLSLVLSGDDRYFWPRVRQEFTGRDIIFTGFVTDEQLVALYKGAKAFVLPSLEEGFGLPLLEAMACSCPIISSNAGSLPEIGKDAAIYFDPKKLDDLEKKISQILNSEKLRQQLIEKGQKRVEVFDWEKLAKETLEVYTKCV